ncbi:unnamed protein product [Victoria cruziana]
MTTPALFTYAFIWHIIFACYNPFMKSFKQKRITILSTDIHQSFFPYPCYYDKSKVTDELIQKILLPGLEPGAAEVFLEFICYSGGPLPEELLGQVQCPVLIGWGDKDPWEPIKLGKAYADFKAVEDFAILPNVGHCPQDEAPDLVNPLIASFVAKHASKDFSLSNGAFL